MKNLFYKPIFWILFGLASVLCTVFTVRYFSQAVPIVSVPINIDRSQALQKAAELAHNHNWGPQNFDQTAEFSTDSDVKTFVELDAGGVPAFTAMIEKDLYMPYQWHVRHFKEFDAYETEIRFKPNGTPYSFEITLPENLQKPNVSPETALQIAQT